jgi:hypothetical protein
VREERRNGGRGGRGERERERQRGREDGGRGINIGGEGSEEG